MKTTAFNYSRFAFNTIIKKKSTIIMPIIIFVCSIIVGFIFQFAVSSKYLSLAGYLYAFTILLITVIFASIKALNIFKDFEHEGLELISLSKPISRSQLILGKLVTLIYFGLIWALVLSISALTGLYGVYAVSTLFIYALLYLFVGLCTYLIIGLITALIAYKVNQKIAITLPLAFFIPMTLGGVLLSANTTSNVNNVAYFLNKKYPYHLSGNEVNAEPYYINNHKDELLLIPNGQDNKTFSKEQKDYLENVMKIANKSSTEWQIYSWLSLPYQLLDIFNPKNKNVFETISKNNFSNLDRYVYYNDLDDITYKYKLNTSVSQTKYPNLQGDQLVPSYIIPGLLKNNSVIPNTVNTGVIYARQGASEIDVEFPEDEAQFSSQNNLVGKLKWEYIYEALKDENFNKIAASFVDNFNQKHSKETDLNRIHDDLIDAISKYVNNPESQINRYTNTNVTIFNEYAIREQKLQSEIERKIYFSIALMNYIYFNNQDTNLFKAMIKNTKIASFGNTQFKLEINGFTYEIGGYSSFEKKLYIVKKNNAEKVLVRYDLTKSSSNHLFQASPELFSIARDKQIVNKNIYFVLWIATIAILFGTVYAVYKRKDYK
ncbi:ABC transporter [Mycoplasmopsis californica HAZ160_1]|uniref:ABC transporter n=1 Tax=Mycoplasmopsis californica HAZ160_1 TaxID=1397850 RepID=A0AAT9F7Z3_9BACT|nr:ABC transporter permease [Mycoplasmopsis californica]BAP01007.1 ABC transporter [Mycoplasmopsis californica HAZ160_1]BBG40872.1 ABC transporter [Mycoplasmopsis californica]BBG41466.1 ABC transporter [Mycoplasmopsis californica]BBG42059.1 ABC transporter [Mycoplasmopsis californica]BBG42642.1 ABC transporter [Mycoplasmopsis californica]